MSSSISIKTEAHAKENSITSTKIHPIIGVAKISEDMFDSRGNKDFTKLNGIFSRGGYDYEQPVGWVGYGINVSGKYDNGDDSWLATSENPKAWAVAYHGIGQRKLSPLQALKSIIDPDGIPDVADRSSKEGDSTNGQTSKNKLLLGPSQGCLGVANSNVKTQHLYSTIPKGIYCSPKISMAQGFTSPTAVGVNGHMLVLMLRVRPESITSNRTAWIIKDSADVRPYRILLRPYTARVSAILPQRRSSPEPKSTVLLNKSRPKSQCVSKCSIF